MFPHSIIIIWCVRELINVYYHITTPKQRYDTRVELMSALYHIKI